MARNILSRHTKPSIFPSDRTKLPHHFPHSRPFSNRPYHSYGRVREHRHIPAPPDSKPIYAGLELDGYEALQIYKK